MVSIGRWSEPWSCSSAIRHVIVRFAASLEPQTRSIVVPALGYVTVPGGSSRFSSSSAIMSTSASASSS